MLFKSYQNRGVSRKFVFMPHKTHPKKRSSKIAAASLEKSIDLDCLRPATPIYLGVLSRRSFSEAGSFSEDGRKRAIARLEAPNPGADTQAASTAAAKRCGRCNFIKSCSLIKREPA